MQNMSIILHLKIWKLNDELNFCLLSKRLVKLASKLARHCKKYARATFGTDESQILLCLFEQVNVRFHPNYRYFAYRNGQQRELHENKF